MRPYNIAPQVYHNLPQPDYEEFVGREAELAHIHQLLRPHPQSRHYLVVIDGIGGIGKSALALEVAYHYLRNYDMLSPEERFEAIVWTSAKSNILTAEGIKPRRQVMRTWMTSIPPLRWPCSAKTLLVLDLRNKMSLCARH